MEINKASAEELENAFQVDGTRARYIVEHRQKQGSFKSWEDVKQVPGFEDKMVDKPSCGRIDPRKIRKGSSRRAYFPILTRKRDASIGPAQSRERDLDLNSATPEELERVSQLDGERARYLIEARDRLGGFKSWDDVKREALSLRRWHGRTLEGCWVSHLAVHQCAASCPTGITTNSGVTACR